MEKTSWREEKVETDAEDRNTSWASGKKKELDQLRGMGKVSFPSQGKAS